AIRFADACAGEGIVEVSSRPRFTGEVVWSKGTGSASVLLAARTHHYRVRCVSEGEVEDTVRARGTIRVMRDDGTRPLPTRPPENVVDADGRRYTVLYQNRLPEITFRWPRTAGSGPFVLHLEPA